MDVVKDAYQKKHIFSDAEKEQMRQEYTRWDFYHQTYPTADAFIDARMRAQLYDNVSPLALEVITKLVWVGSLLDADECAEHVYAWVIAAYEKLPEHGARHTALGNACVWALEQIDPSRGVPMLMRLAQRKINRTVEKTIQKSLQRKAAKLGISQDDLEDSLLPVWVR